MNHFFIIMTGRNCQSYVVGSIQSVLAQKYDNWTLVVCSDGSTDNTNKNIQELLAKLPSKYVDKIKIVFGEDRLHAACRRHEAIKKYSKDENDICLFLGMDDELYPNCLTIIDNKYKTGVWMSYGNWRNQHGRTCTVPLDFPEHIHAGRDYRKVKYRSTAPNTFRRFLYDAIPEEDFKIDSKWIDTCTEGEVMFSCLEMCGEERIGVIKTPIYYYRESLNTGTLATQGAAYKYDVYAKIISRAKRDLLVYEHHA